MNRFTSVLMMLLLAAGMFGCASSSTYQPMTSASTSMSTMPAEQSTVNLQAAMRELWADHVIWTRQYIASAVAGSADAQAASQRLLKNQEQIGAAIVPYYGQAAGDKLTALLKDHILIAVDLVSAAKANDQAKLAAADQKWHANAADIATFLSGANPNWKRAEVLSMMNEHLALTTKEAVSRIKGNWSDDINTFDKIFDQAMMMADSLTIGIVAQFPSRFSKEMVASTKSMNH